MSPHDTEYYRERANAERALAKSAEHRHVAEIHEELAKQYEALAAHPELARQFRYGAPVQPLRSCESAGFVVLR